MFRRIFWFFKVQHIAKQMIVFVRLGQSFSFLLNSYSFPATVITKE
jgi:hypothetical protein